MPAKNYYSDRLLGTEAPFQGRLRHEGTEGENQATKPPRREAAKEDAETPKGQNAETPK